MRRLIAVAVAVVAIAGCSDGEQPAVEVVENSKPSTTGPDETTTTDAPSPVEAARGYFEAFATSDVVAMGEMLDLSVEGSPAHLYGIHQIGLIRLSPEPPDKITFDSDSIEMCDSVAVENVNACTTYTDFQADESGKLAGFRVGGRPLGEQIAAGGPEVASQGVAVKVTTAYQAASGRLFVLFDVRNDTDEPLPFGQFQYITPDGRQVATEASALFSDIQPGATAADVGIFPAVERGGTLVYRTHTDDFANQVELHIPVP